MNIEAIKNTAICRYSNEDGGIYIVESPLLEIACGAATTKEEAWEIFNDLAEAVYIEYLRGHAVAQYSRGRPSKGAVHTHVQIQPNTKAGIAVLSKNLNISQGEVIDYLFAFYNAKNSEPTITDNGNVERTELKALKTQLQKLCLTVDKLIPPTAKSTKVYNKTTPKLSRKVS